MGATKGAPYLPKAVLATLTLKSRLGALKTALLVLLALFKQLALARRGKLLPGGGHLLKMLSMAWRRGPCHLTAPGRMLMIFVDFSQRALGSLWSAKYPARVVRAPRVVDGGHRILAGYPITWGLGEGG